MATKELFWISVLFVLAVVVLLISVLMVGAFMDILQTRYTLMFSEEIWCYVN